MASAALDVTLVPAVLVFAPARRAASSEEEPTAVAQLRNKEESAALPFSQALVE